MNNQRDSNQNKISQRSGLKSMWRQDTTKISIFQLYGHLVQDSPCKAMFDSEGEDPQGNSRDA